MNYATINIQIHLRGDFMKKLKRTTMLLAALSFAVSMPLGASVAASAATSDNSSPNVKAVSATAPERPDVTMTYYNTMVAYKWDAGYNGDQLAMYRYQYNLIGSDSYFEYAVAKDTYGSTECDPRYYAAKSYNNSTGLYSSETSLEHGVDMGDYTQVRYGYDCKIAATGEFPTAHYPTGTTVPTEYDKSYFIASHNADWRDYIKGTICYQGIYLSDIQVRVPLLGYETASVTLNGVTFTLRTGPNKVSIKASHNGINMGDFTFMYGID